MKNIKLIVSFCLLTLVVFTSCSDDDYKLGTLPDKSEITYEVYQDLNLDPGGNTVIVKNTTPETILTWNYGTGKSNKSVDTIQYAFKGDYTIDITATTGAGLVHLDPVTISVTDDNLNYVDDPLWTALSGGVGESKTWVLDLDAEGVSKYFVGPQYFYGTDNGWLDGGQDGCYVEGGDCWNWSPDYAGNSWLMPAADYGTMTFSLDGGPYVTVDHLTIPARGTESGSYFLDSNAKTLTMTDATILHPESIESCVDSWANMRIFSLTEDALQLGVLRKSSCDGAAYLVYNFISKEYSDNWVPEDIIPEVDEGFDPTFQPGELLQVLTGGPAAGRFWKLDGSGNPVDWLAGGIGWTTSSADSYDWGWNDAWTDTATNSWIRFDQYGGSQNYYKNQNGVETTGTFTINEDTNEITLSDAGTLIGVDGHWMSPTTSTFTVIKAVPNDFESFGLWFGTSYDEGKDEWLTFHYIINNDVSGGGGTGGGGSGGDGTEIPFDNSKLAIGDLEGNGNLRLEIYNEFGTTINDPGLDTTALVFSESVAVTFTLNGVSLADGAAGSYDASMYYADADWNPNGNGETITVNGDGTYTVTYTPGADANGAVVFVVDIIGLFTDLSDPTAVSATIDSIVIK